MKRLSLLLALVSASLFACNSDSDNDIQDEANDTSNVAQLSDLDALLSGYLPNEQVQDEAKCDQVFPAKFDLMATQSPVKDQGSRGVCSIFATTALMEHLYIKEGTVANPDFSEQFLQWSVKNEVKAFTDIEGSNNYKNIEAITRFGIVEESVLPYQSSSWSSRQDARCTGKKDQPVLCYTNGDPSEEVMAARRWKLQADDKGSRQISSKPKNIKAYMYENHRAVATSMTFFYQGWNHGGSPYAINSQYKANGYVMYPNDDDKAHGLEHKGGHAVLIVGWDDDLEVPRIDKNGKQMLDENGNVLTEKGFWLIKNSWGTNSTWGRNNPMGKGYGWLSYRYAEEYGFMNVAAEPKLNLDKEICDDGIDNNGDHRIDCQDVQCKDAKVCQPITEICDDEIDNDDNGLIDCEDPGCEGSILCVEDDGLIRGENNEPVLIPDNDDDGIESIITIDAEGTVKSVKVHVEIEHPYRSDLSIMLLSPDGDLDLLLDREGFNQEDVRETFVTDAFKGQSIGGDWSLWVLDEGEGEEGILESWSLEILPKSIED